MGLFKNAAGSVNVFDTILDTAGNVIESNLSRQDSAPAPAAPAFDPMLLLYGFLGLFGLVVVSKSMNK